MAELVAEQLDERAADIVVRFLGRQISPDAVEVAERADGFAVVLAPLALHPEPQGAQDQQPREATLDPLLCHGAIGPRGPQAQLPSPGLLGVNYSCAAATIRTVHPPF